jgi:hypothetical protein
MYHILHHQTLLDQVRMWYLYFDNGSNNSLLVQEVEMALVLELEQVLQHNYQL